MWGGRNLRDGGRNLRETVGDPGDRRHHQVGAGRGVRVLVATQLDGPDSAGPALVVAAGARTRRRPAPPTAGHHRRTTARRLTTVPGDDRFSGAALQ